MPSYFVLSVQCRNEPARVDSRKSSRTLSFSPHCLTASFPKTARDRREKTVLTLAPPLSKQTRGRPPNRHFVNVSIRRIGKIKIPPRDLHRAEIPASGELERSK
jgi:hypothetical protein